MDHLRIYINPAIPNWAKTELLLMSERMEEAYPEFSEQIITEDPCYVAKEFWLVFGDPVLSCYGDYCVV